MATRAAKGGSWGWAARLGVGAGGLLLLAGIAVAVVWLVGKPRVSVTSSDPALAQVHVGGLGAKLTALDATSAGRPLTLVHGEGGLVPATSLSQGQTVTVRAEAKPPSWLRWLLGQGVSTTTTVVAPTASPTTSVAVSSDAGHVAVSFSHPVSVVDYRVEDGPPEVLHLARAATEPDLSVPAKATAGSLRITAAPASWERVAPVTTKVTWFVVPAGGGPVALADPAPGSATAAPNSPITLTFDQPVATALGRTRPKITPTVAGSWSEPNPDTLVFTPSGFGFGPGAAVTVSFDRSVSVETTTSTVTTTTAASNAYHFSTGPGSLLRLEQLLAQLHYLPLTFTPAPGVQLPTTFETEAATISKPLAGSFSWRWADTPASLEADWDPSSPNLLVRGALMAFDAATNPDYDGYQADDDTVDQLADAATWKALLEAAVKGQLDPSPYSYVYVSQALPETLTIWENGADVLSSPCNTGIPEAPTATGTYPIYVRYTFNYMSGFNPDGSYYDDPVYWINYFNGGDAVHGFVRASYGFPQSLGCVELPIPTAQVAFGELAIGDLVTVD